MIELKKITIQNFLSFGHKPITIPLNDHDTTLIIGENKDVGTEGYSRNGVGKSTIFQALSWVLFNEGISNIKQDAFVNIVNKKKMVVELEMVVNDIEFVIRRGRKPAVCEVLKDGDPYTMHSAATVDETIEKLIGVNFDTFCNAVLLNTTTIPFMGMKPAPQRNFMEKMVGLDVLTERADVLKSRNKDVVVDIKLEEQNQIHVVNNNGKTQIRITQLENNSENWIANNAAEIKDITSEIKALSIIDTDKTLKNNQVIREQKEAVNKIKILIDNIDTEHDTKVAAFKSTYDINYRNTEKDELIASSKADTTYKVDVAALKKMYRDKISQVQEGGHENSNSSFKKRHKIETLLSESKALLKESNDFCVDSAKQLKSLVDSDTKLNDEALTLAAGTCPYCEQPYTNDKKLNGIRHELIANTKDAEEIGDDVDRILDGIKNVKVDIEKYEENLVDINNVIYNMESELKDALSSLESEEDSETDKLVDIVNKEKSRLGNILIKQCENLDAEYDAACVSASIESAHNKRDFQAEVDKLSTDIKDEVYTDAECAEIVSTLKQQKLNLEKLKDESNPYADQLIQVKSELVEYDETILFNLKEKESHYKLLIKMLTDNKSFVRKNLLDQYVPYINGKINEYAGKLDLPHVVMINNDLTVDIDYMQNSVSYGNLSNGERGRLDFSVSMAFRDLLSVSGHKFNFLGIDELLDNGIDTSGFHAIFKLLKTHQKENVFLISHRDDLITEVDSIMTVVKENGFTKIT